MAFCQNCGTNMNDARFCAGCGAPAPQAEPAMTAAPPVMDASAPAPEMRQPVMAAPAQEQAASAYRPQEAAYQQQPVQQGQAHAAPFHAGQPQAAPQGQPPGAYGQQPTYRQPAGQYAASAYPQQPPQYAHSPAPGYGQPMQQYPQQGYPGHAYPQINVADVQMKKGMAVLAYFSYLVLIPLFAARDNKFARYHVNQGIVLTIVFTILSVLSNLAVSILTPISTMLALIVTGVISLLILVVCIFSLIGIINAVKGRMKPVPIFGGITLIK